MRTIGEVLRKANLVKMERLNKIPLFSKWSLAQLASLYKHFRQTDLVYNQVIYAKGSLDENIHIIMEGEVHIETDRRSLLDSEKGEQPLMFKQKDLKPPFVVTCLNQIKKYAQGSYFGNEEGFDQIQKEFTARVSSHSCRLMSISKRQIKQNMFFEHGLMKELESVSDKRQRQLKIDYAFAKGRFKVEAKKLKGTIKLASPKEADSPNKEVLKKAKILHGLDHLTLSDLDRKGLLPQFTQNFESFNKQSTERRIQMAGELLDNCISHFITSESDKLRLKKKQKSNRLATETSLGNMGSNYLTFSAQTLVNSCRQIVAKDSPRQVLDPALMELSSSRFDNKTSLKGKSTSTKFKNMYSIKQGQSSDRSLKSRLGLSGGKINLDMSKSLLAKNLGNTMSGKHLVADRYFAKRDPGSIKAAELFPKIKSLMKDSVSILGIKPTAVLSKPSEESTRCLQDVKRSTNTRSMLN